MNVSRLRKIQSHILKEPRRLIMRCLMERGIPGDKIVGDFDREQIIPECGTVACIGGWAATFWPNKFGGQFIGQQALGLSNSQADALFFDYRWPQPFRSQYKRAVAPKTKAKIAVARIEHMIETGQ